jgi:hypothetical protein
MNTYTIILLCFLSFFQVISNECGCTFDIPQPGDTLELIR